MQKINKKEKSINDFNIHKFQLQLTENGADTTSSYFLFAEQRKLALKENQIPNDFSIDSAVELAQLYRGAGDREKYQYYSDLADQLSI